jgi:hypothetical protein
VSASRFEIYEGDVLGSLRNSLQWSGREDSDGRMKRLIATDRGNIYQISFSPNCIWRDAVVVDVRTPAEEIGVPLPANRLVLFVGTTGDAKFV